MGLREDVADQQEPAEITLDIQTALQLGRPQAAGCVRLVHRDQLVVGQRDVQPGGVRRDGAVPTPEQSPQRLAGLLRLAVLGVPGDDPRIW